MKGYWDFVKWYFDYTTQRFFCDRYKCRTRSPTRKERLPVIVSGYVLFLGSLVLTVVRGGLFLLWGVSVLTCCLFLSEFGFLYYYVLYRRFCRKEKSVNDRLLVEECILHNSNLEIRKLISRYFRVVEVKGTVFSLKIDLSKRSNKRKALSRKDIVTLKVTPEKMYFNHVEIFSGKVTDLSDLENFLREQQN